MPYTSTSAICQIVILPEGRAGSKVFLVLGAGKCRGGWASCETTYYNDCFANFL